MKLFTWRLTVSVKGDLLKECEKKVLAYLTKRCRFVYAVAERGSSNRRHMHAAICFKQEIDRHHLIGYIWKMVQEYHADSLRRHAVNLHAMYDNTWHSEYLQKENDCEVLYNNYDPEKIAEYFPTQSEQEELMLHVVDGTDDRVADPYIDKLVNQWTEHDPNERVERVTYERACRYLKYCMFDARTMRCISDNRRFCQLAWTMFQYRTRRTEIDVAELNYGNIQTGNGC